MCSYISVRVLPLGENFKRFEVPRDIYMYIRQLENFINNPEQSKMLEAYPERFKESPFGEGIGLSLRSGLTKRELFAAMAMQGLLVEKDSFYKNDAEIAVKYADALLEALGKS